MIALLEHEERQNALKKESESNVESNEKNNENTIEYNQYTDDENYYYNYIDESEDDSLFFGCCIMYKMLFRTFFGYKCIKN
jgi:hypothetical protein